MAQLEAVKLQLQQKDQVKLEKQNLAQTSRQVQRADDKNAQIRKQTGHRSNEARQALSQLAQQIVG